MSGSGGHGKTEHEYYNRHRFDNYGAWLDREDRLKAVANNKPKGWGFCEPRPPLPPKEEKPFHVLEQAFASQQLVTRKYHHIECPFKTEDGRTDPYHYPNDIGTTDNIHYGDYRRRSCNIDPSKWKELPGDKVLRDAVTDGMVQARIKSEAAEKSKPIPPEMQALLAQDVRLDRASIRELQHEDRTDFSCFDVPDRDDPKRSSRTRSDSLSQSKSRWALSGGNAPPPPPPEPPEGGRGMPPAKADPNDDKGKWGWCLGGRPPPFLGQPTHAEQRLVMSRSLPVMIPGQSLLNGNNGGETSPFHGVNTRKFGPERWDGRMRGGRLARDGWAGTFPSKETRPG